MTELKPCPFCNERLTFRSSRHGDDFYQHSRSNCVLSGGSLGDPVKVWADDESIAAWSRRAVQGQAAPEAPDRARLAQEVKDAINELAEGRSFPDLMDAVDALVAAPEARMLTMFEVLHAIDNHHIFESDAQSIQRKFCEVNGLSIGSSRDEGGKSNG